MTAHARQALEVALGRPPRGSIERKLHTRHAVVVLLGKRAGQVAAVNVTREAVKGSVWRKGALGGHRRAPRASHAGTVPHARFEHDGRGVRLKLHGDACRAGSHGAIRPGCQARQLPMALSWLFAKRQGCTQQCPFGSAHTAPWSSPSAGTLTSRSAMSFSSMSSLTLIARRPSAIQPRCVRCDCCLRPSIVAETAAAWVLGDNASSELRKLSLGRQADAGEGVSYAIASITALPAPGATRHRQRGGAARRRQRGHQGACGRLPGSWKGAPCMERRMQVQRAAGRAVWRCFPCRTRARWALSRESGQRHWARDCEWRHRLAPSMVQLRSTSQRAT